MPHIPPETTLVSATISGDAEAFAALYDHYAPQIHTYCLGRLRDTTEAAEALRATFVRAHGEIDRLGDPTTLRPWLFGIARRVVGDTARRRDHSPHRREWGAVASPDDTPAQLLDDAVADLQPQDQDLFWLHTRHGLDGADLALALDEAPEQLVSRKQRLDDRLTASVGSLLVAADGRASCVVLDRILADADDNVGVAIRARIARHVESCETCTATRRGLEPWSTLAGTMPTKLPPAQVRRLVLAALGPAVDDPPSTTGDDVSPRIDAVLPTDADIPTEPDEGIPTELDADSTAEPAGDPVAHGESRGRLRALLTAIAGFLIAAAVLTGAILAWPVLTGPDEPPPDTIPPDAIPADTPDSGTSGEITSDTSTDSLPGDAPTTSTSPTVPDAGGFGPVFFGSTDPIILTSGAPVEFTFANVGDEAMSWQTETVGPYTARPSDGTLAPGDSTTLTLSATTADAGEAIPLGLLRLVTGQNTVEIILAVSDDAP